MNNILTWCEIPVTDMERAKAFYKEVVGVEFIEQNTDDMKMAMFQSSSPTAASGALVQSAGYEPSATASVPYLWGGNDLNDALGRAKKLGAPVVIEKTAIMDDGGYFAQLQDSEGNRIGLYSLG